MENSLIGTTLNNKYNILKLIGKGGQCFVYLAFDKKIQRDVVIKELIHKSKDDEIQAQNIIMFKKEYELLYRLEHTGLPRSYDYFQIKNRHFLVVEYIKGENLKKILDNVTSGFSEEEVIEWGTQIAHILIYLSHIKPNPVLIRDIKPANIMLTPEGMVKLIDFTIARELDMSKTGDTVRIGSIGYAPPEQYKGKSDIKSDIYALGATLYQLLTKHDPSTTPFQFEPIRHKDPAISKDMETILKKALELDPSRRYQRPEELFNDLQALKKGQVISVNYANIISSMEPEGLAYSPSSKQSCGISYKLIIFLIVGLILSGIIYFCYLK
ncbi:MAG TPA: serine/threonine-protein kinase [Candidatus Eremiobacteraeota bacterium]|nr:serine/threonine-protein kinase [Candidatus Eremiobacteraeota bacterium]